MRKQLRKLPCRTSLGPAAGSLPQEQEVRLRLSHFKVDVAEVGQVMER